MGCLHGFSIQLGRFVKHSSSVPTVWKYQSATSVTQYGTVQVTMTVLALDSPARVGTPYVCGGTRYVYSTLHSASVPLSDPHCWQQCSTLWYSRADHCMSDPPPPQLWPQKLYAETVSHPHHVPLTGSARPPLTAVHTRGRFSSSRGIRLPRKPVSVACTGWQADRRWIMSQFLV